jgi:hypothetical protein
LGPAEACVPEQDMLRWALFDEQADAILVPLFRRNNTPIVGLAGTTGML